MRCQSDHILDKGLPAALWLAAPAAARSGRARPLDDLSAIRLRRHPDGRGPRRQGQAVDATTARFKSPPDCRLLQIGRPAVGDVPLRVARRGQQRSSDHCDRTDGPGALHLCVAARAARRIIAVCGKRLHPGGRKRDTFGYAFRLFTLNCKTSSQFTNPLDVQWYDAHRNMISSFLENFKYNLVVQFF